MAGILTEVAEAKSLREATLSLRQRQAGCIHILSVVSFSDSLRVVEVAYGVGSSEAEAKASLRANLRRGGK